MTERTEDGWSLSSKEKFSNVLDKPGEITHRRERKKKKISRRKLHRVNYERNPILEQKDCATCIQSNVELLATTHKDNRAA